MAEPRSPPPCGESVGGPSNRAPEEWADSSREPFLAAAGLDRPTRQAQAMMITGASSRARGTHKEMAIELTPA